MLRDIEDGLVAVKQAEREYGVVAVDGAVDVEATQSARRRLREQAPAAASFSFGQRRAQHEQLWPVSWQRALNDAVSRAPSMIRQHVRDQLMDECESEGVTAQAWDPDRARAWLEERTDALLTRLDAFTAATFPATEVVR